MKSVLREVTRKCCNGRRVFALLLFFLLSATIPALAQFKIDVVVPTKVINVGYNSEVFSVTAQNTGTAAVPSVQISITQPNGMLIDPSGYTVSIEGVAVPVSNYTISSNTITVNQSIPASGTLVLTYSAHATCSMISGTLYDPTKPIVVTDNITLTANAVEYKANSDSYNVKYADLQVLTAGGSSSSMKVEWSQSYDRFIPIINGKGAGSSNNVALSIQYDDNTVLAVPQGEIALTQAGPWVAVDAPVYNTTTKSYVFLIGADKLAALGLGQSFDGDENLLFKEKIKVVKQKTNHRTDYKASWYETGSNCDLSRNNAGGTLYLTQDPVSASVSISATVETKANPCTDRKALCHLTIKNNGTTNLNTALNLNATLYGTGHQIPTEVRYKGIVLPLILNGSYWTIGIGSTDLDGVGIGLEDLDGDGAYDDLAAGQSIVLDMDVEYTDVSASGFSAGDRYIRYSISYSTVALESRYDYNYLEDYDTFSASSSGALDFVGNTNQSFSLYYSAPTYYYNVLSSTNISDYFVTLELPTGIDLNDAVPVMSGTKKLTASQTDRIITITGVSNSETISLSLKADCSVKYGEVPLKWTVKRALTPCAAAMTFGSSSFTTVLHEGVNCGTSTGGTGTTCFAIGRFPTFDARRITYGYNPTGHTGLWYESDLATTPKATPADGINDKIGLVNDDFQFTLNDQILIGSCQPDHISAVMYYKGAAANLFSHKSAVFTMNGKNYSLSAPSITTENGMVRIEYTVPASLVGNFTTGDMTVKAVLTANKDAVGEGSSVNLQYLRAKFDVAIAADTYTTDDYGTTLQIFRPQEFYFYSQDYTSTVCSGRRNLYFNTYHNASFPKEFRSMTHVKNFSFTLPDGYSFKTGSLKVSCNYVELSGYSVSVSGKTVTVSGTFPLISSWEYFTISYDVDAAFDAPFVNTAWTINRTQDDFSNPVPNTTNFKFETASYNTISRPTYGYVTETNQPGYENKVTWRTYLQTSYTSAPNTWLSFDMPKTNKANITIRKVIVDNTTFPASSFYAKDGKVLVNIGASATNSYKVIQIEASYTNCGTDNVDTIHINGGSSCIALTSLDEAVSEFKGNLTLTNKAADMQSSAQIVENVAGKYYDLCEPIEFAAAINSTSLGNMYNLGFWFDKFPSNVVLESDAVNYSFDGKAGTIIDSLNAPQNSNISYRLYKNYKDGLPGHSNPVNLNFKVHATCGVDADARNQIEFHIKGVTNCNEPKEEIKRFQLRIKGFEQLDSVKMQLSAQAFTQRNGTSKFTMLVKNISSVFVNKVYSQVELPQGFGYVANSTSLSGVEPTQKVSSNGTLLTWEIPSSLYFKPGEQLSFSFTVKDNTVCPSKKAVFAASTYLLRTVSGCGSSCEMKGTTDRDTVELSPIPVNAGTLSGDAVVCAEATGNYELTNSLPAAYTYAWALDSAPKGVITANGKKASVAFTAGFTGTAKVLVIPNTGSCNLDTLSVLVTVSQKPAVHVTAPSIPATASSFVLTTGTPAGGVYKARGVTTSPNYSVSKAGTGNDTLIYEYDNAGCKNSDTTIIEISCDPKVSIDSLHVCLGDTITVPIRISGVSTACGFNNFETTLNFDDSKLEIVDVTMKNSVMPGGDLLWFDLGHGQVYCGFNTSWDNPYETVQGSGTLFFVRFKTKTTGLTPITFTLPLINGGLTALSDGEATIHSLPTVAIDGGTVCYGQCKTLNPTPSGFKKYLWNDSSTASKLDACKTGIYAVTVADQYGCKAKDTANVTVLESPKFSPKVGAACLNDTIRVQLYGKNLSKICEYNNFEANVSYDSTNLTYVGFDLQGTLMPKGDPFMYEINPGYLYVSLGAYWPEPYATFQNQGNLVTLKFISKKAGSYPLSLSNFLLNGTPIDSLGTDTVKINALPTVSAGTDVTICNGATANLSASGAVSYAWNTSEATAAIAVSPTTTTTYSVTGTDANGCQNSDAVVVNVNTLPTVSAGADATICTGTSTNLTASGAVSYVWNTSEATAAIAVSPTTTTTYSVTGTDANGCQSSDEVVVNVNTLPTVSAGADATICTGASTNLTASGAVSYTWNTGEATVAIAVSPTTTTTYSVTGTDANGCQNSDEVVVNVNTLPTVSAGTDVTICNGATANLNASGAVSYAWNTSEATAAIAVSPTTTTTYSVTGTDANGCQNSDEVVVNVNTLPTVSAGTDVTICNGATANLNASGAVSYAWNTSEATAAIAVSPTTTTTYSVTGTDANGCQNSDAVVVNVNTLPTVSAGADATICNGASTNLTASGAVSYAWNTGEATAAIAVSPTTTTTYSVTGTDANGCQNSDAVVVNVNTLPTVSAGADATICTGASTNLTASGAVSYVWNTSEATAAIAVSPTTTTTYSVTGTDANGCQNSDAVVVNVNTLPTVSAGADATICTGASTNLTASGAVSYVWNTSEATAAIAVSPTTTTTYSVTGTDANGCQNSDAVVVNVNTLPTVSAGTDVTICNGATANLSASGAVSYVWNTSEATAAIAVSPTTTTTYSVTGTDANGCQNSDAVVVNVNTLPTVSAGADATICNGATANLSASGAVSYAWNTSEATAAISVAPTTTTTYSVTGTDANGCQNSDEVVVNVNTLPTVSAGADATICNGASTNLTASGAVSYVWNTGDATAAIAVSPTVTATYSVTGTDANGCQNSDEVVVNVNTLPTVSAGTDITICNGATANLSAIGAVSYAWNTSEATAAIAVSPTTTTTYSVTGTDANGCQNYDEVVVNVNALPTVSISADPANVCIGGSTNITATGGASYVWSTGETTATITVAPTTAQSYSVTVTSDQSCIANGSISIAVYALPTVSINDAAICKGETHDFYPGDFAEYEWQDGSGAGHLLATVKGTYSVTITDANGCKNSDSAYLTVHDLPVLIQKDDTVFTSQCSQVKAILDPGAGFVSYLWNTGATTQKLETYSIGLYSVTVTDGNGCKNSVIDTVTEYKFIAGEVDHNPLINKVSAYDAQLVYNYILNPQIVSNFWPDFFYAADVAPAYGVIDANDYSAIRRYAGSPILYPFPICQGSPILKAGKEIQASVSVSAQDGKFVFNKKGDLNTFTFIGYKTGNDGTITLQQATELTSHVWAYNCNYNIENKIIWIKNLDPIADGAFVEMPFTANADEVTLYYKFSDENYTNQYDSVTIKLKSITDAKELASVSEDASFEVYPNPVVNQELTAKASFFIAEYEIVTANGASISVGKANATKLQLSVESLAAGTYFIIAKDAEHKLHKATFIKQ